MTVMDEDESKELSKLKPNYLALGLPGLPSVKNRGALDWCSNCFIAYGNGTDVIILDPVQLTTTIILPTEHKSSVNRVSWNPHARPFVSDKPDKQPRDLVSVDTSDNLVIWDIGKCYAVSNYTHPEFKSLLNLKWSNGADVWQKTKLFILYSGSMFVILDIVTLTFQNISLVEEHPSLANELTILDFDCEPSSSPTSSLAFVGDHSVYIKSNWDPLKMKQERIILPNSIVYKAKLTSPHPQGNQDTNPSNKKYTSSSGIRKLVSDMIVGAEYPSTSNVGIDTTENATSIQFHKNLNYHLVVSTSRQIFLINTQFNVILNTFSYDRSATNLVQVILSTKRPALFTLQENGTISLRKYTISGAHTQAVTLEIIGTSDPPRLSTKKSEVLGIMLDKHLENKVILHLSDGRFISYNIVGISSHGSTLDTKVQHLVTPMTPFISSSSMSHSEQEVTGRPRPLKQSCEPLPLDTLLKTILHQETDGVKISLKKATVAVGTLTCIKSRPNSDLIIAGTSAGFLLMINVEADETQKRCVIKKRFAVHSNTSVSGLEFLSNDEIISFANLSFSANPKCEMMITEIGTGSTRILKQDEPHHISLLKVSPLGQFLLLVYKNGMAPCELWDLPRKQLIKTLPSKLPPITCAVWKEPVKGVKEEIFYMTDLGTFLFTFRVEGSRFASATCVKLDTTGNAGGVPVSLVARGKLVFRADSSGMLVIYDTEKKTASPGVPLGRGPLVKIENGMEDFTSLIVVQFSDQVEIWHLTEIKRLITLMGPKHQRILDFCWMNGYLAIIPRSSGGISFLPVMSDVTLTTSSERLHLHPYFFTAKEKFLKFFMVLQGQLTHSQLIRTFEELCCFEEAEFWEIVAHSLLLKSDPSCVKPIFGLNAYSNDRFYKEVMVKIAQCVWFCDMSKREDVAKVLLWAGESEKSAEILLDTEPSDAKKYISNGMKAALSVAAATLPESTKAVLKIVATNLLASGETDDGLELLCLLSKHSEAVKYVESANDWSKAILLSKTSLNPKQAHDCLSKFGHYLNSQRQVLKSASIYAYIGKYDRAIEVLFGGRKRHLCYALLSFCESSGIDLTNLSDHVKTAIRLDFTRLIFDCGLLDEAINFCNYIGDEAMDLRSELEILGS